MANSRFQKLRELMTPTPPDATDEEIQGRVAALGNGTALGAGSRLGAGMQAGMAALTGGDPQKTYDTALTENRDILNRQREREPVRTTALEIAGGVPASMAMGAVGAAGKVGTFANRMREALNTGGKLGLFAGALGSDKNIGTLGHLKDSAEGLLGGAALGPAAEAVSSGVGALAKAARLKALLKNDLTRMKPGYFGDEIAGRAEGYEQQELDKLANRGTTWGDQETGFKNGPWSGMRQTEVLNPDGSVRVPMASRQEVDLFDQMVKDAKQKVTSTEGTKNLRLSRGTAVSPTKEADREELLRAFRNED
jgi:hypothetical protein